MMMSETLADTESAEDGVMDTEGEAKAGAGVPGTIVDTEDSLFVLFFLPFQGLQIPLLLLSLFD